MVHLFVQQKENRGKENNNQIVQIINLKYDQDLIHHMNHR